MFWHLDLRERKFLEPVDLGVCTLNTQGLNSLTKLHLPSPHPQKYPLPEVILKTIFSFKALGDLAFMYREVVQATFLISLTES